MTEERITSRRNPLLAHTKKLLTSRAYREKCGEFAADGVKLLAEAARWYPGLHTVIAEEKIELCKFSDTVRVVRVPKDVMQSVSLMDAPQGAIFLCRLPAETEPRLTPGTLLLDGIQDPGNLGTILRTADALEVPIVLLDGCADAYNPKTVRASMGAVFRTQPPPAEKRGFRFSPRPCRPTRLTCARQISAHPPSSLAARGRGSARRSLTRQSRRSSFPCRRAANRSMPPSPRRSSCGR